jgi:hypothetical protein
MENDCGNGASLHTPATMEGRQQRWQIARIAEVSAPLARMRRAEACGKPPDIPCAKFSSSKYPDLLCLTQGVRSTVLIGPALAEIAGIAEFRETIRGRRC